MKRKLLGPDAYILHKSTFGGEHIVSCITTFTSSLLVLLAFNLWDSQLLRAQQPAAVSGEKGSQRLVSVEDAIGMTRIADQGYFLGDPANTHIAHFSPDGKQFVIILKKGNLEQNTNDFTLFLFQTNKAFHGAKPDVLLKMSSSSNRDAIASLKWLDDNETLVFLGEKPSKLPQVCTFNIKTRRFDEITSHATEIRSYDISSDGRTLVYQALAPKASAGQTDRFNRNGVIISGQSLPSLMTNAYEQEGEEIFLKRRGSSPLQVPINTNFVARGLPISLSRDGRYALIHVATRNVPAGWARYGGYIHQLIVASHPKGSVLPIMRYLLFDTERQTIAPLLDAPAVGWAPVWASDGRSVFLNTYLPLDAAGPTDTSERETTYYPVEVQIPSRAYKNVTEDKWPSDSRSDVGVDVTIVQDLNTPQHLYISDRRSHQRSLLMDLNPQFAELQLGRVEIIEWKVKGITLRGGLYLPPDYTPGKRYPLVIQTHGFGYDEEFSMDGLREWSSAYAARPLAAKGLLVLQGIGMSNKVDHDHYNDQRQFGSTSGEAGRNLNAFGIEEAIKYLDQKGMIDTRRVGIVGFSRTVCFVGYILTHSTQHFAAASLVDGVTCGYFDEIAYPESAWDVNNINGDASPFGSGLQKWIRESPSFNLDKVQTPVRILALGAGSLLGMWEWYAGLSLQKKPVEFVLLPDASHFVVKPSERMVAQQGLVDWFCFWLKDEEDPNPAKAEQYARWRQLRANSTSATVPSQGSSSAN